jgi:hypothetical protein
MSLPKEKEPHALGFPSSDDLRPCGKKMHESDRDNGAKWRLWFQKSFMISEHVPK